MRKTDLTNFNWLVSLLMWVFTSVAMVFVAAAYGYNLNHPNVLSWSVAIEIGFIWALATTALGVLFAIPLWRDHFSIQHMQTIVCCVYFGLGIFALMLVGKIMMSVF